MKVSRIIKENMKIYEGILGYRVKLDSDTYDINRLLLRDLKLTQEQEILLEGSALDYISSLSSEDIIATNINGLWVNKANINEDIKEIQSEDALWNLVLTPELDRINQNLANSRKKAESIKLLQHLIPIRTKYIEELQKTLPKSAKFSGSDYNYKVISDKPVDTWLEDVCTELGLTTLNFDLDDRKLDSLDVVISNITREVIAYIEVRVSNGVERHRYSLDDNLVNLRLFQGNIAKSIDDLFDIDDWYVSVDKSTGDIWYNYTERIECAVEEQDLDDEDEEEEFRESLTQYIEEIDEKEEEISAPKDSIFYVINTELKEDGISRYMELEVLPQFLVGDLKKVKLRFREK